MTTPSFNGLIMGIYMAETILTESMETLNHHLFKAASEGDLAAVQKSLLDGADPTYRGSGPLRTAAEHGHLECVRILIPVSEPAIRHSRILSAAAEHGHLECVRLLMPVSKPAHPECHALSLAIEGNHTECVKLLVEVLGPATDLISELIVAAEEGHLECLRLIMPFCDVASHHSQALRHAVEHGNVDCVAALLPFSDPLCAPEGGLNAIQLAREVAHLDIIDMIKAFLEAKALSKTIPVASHSIPSRKAL